MADWKTTLRRVGETVRSQAFGVSASAQRAAAERARPTHVCTYCGYVGKPSIQSSTNGCFAVALLFFFIVPGILYIIFTARGRQMCPKCGRVGSMIPLDTPQGQELVAKSRSAVIGGSTSQRDERPCPYCAEPILAQARVCKHCGRDVAPIR